MPLARLRDGPNCPRCTLRLGICYCDLIAPIPLATKISVVMPCAEQLKSSNTARLLSLASPDCQIHLVGKLGAPFRGVPDLGTAYESLVLYPDPSASELTNEFIEAISRPIHLIVPDGTWSQARRIMYRNLAPQHYRRVRIAPQISRYRLRRNQVRGNLCTAEAVAWALGAIEGPAVRDALLWLLNEFEERVLWSRRTSADFPQTNTL